MRQKDHVVFNLSQNLLEYRLYNKEGTPLPTNHISSSLSVRSGLPSRKLRTQSIAPFPPANEETAASYVKIPARNLIRWFQSLKSFLTESLNHNPPTASFSSTESIVLTVSGCSSRSSISLKSTMIKPRQARHSNRSNEGTFQGWTTPATKLRKRMLAMWEIDLLKHEAPNGHLVKLNLPEADILPVVKQALIFKERWWCLWEEAKDQINLITTQKND